MYINLSGLTILVTGAASGIGKAIATKLAEAGATIAVHCNSHFREAENLAHVLGNNSAVFKADLSENGEAARLFQEVTGRYGSVEVLVNNAGIARPADLIAETSDWEEVWNDTMMVNLQSPAVLCKKAITHFLERRSAGRIINITSRASHRGDQPEYLAYAASKSGMASLAKTLARAYGKQGVRIFNIAPGFVKTAMAREFTDTYGEDYAIKDIALDRLTEPRDVAPLVTFLASGMADHATGATFDLNAGSYIR